MSDFKGILAAVEKHISLNDMERGAFLSALSSQTIKTGEFIARAGEPSQHFIFVSSGCLMSYFTDPDGVERVMQFATAGWWTGDLHSFTNSVPSIYSTRALVDSELFLLTKVDMESFLEKVPKFERYFRILYQNSLVAHQHRLIQAYSATAEDRYQTFREKFSSLEQYVPQKYIASYLGITPEFLSKIRRRLMEK